MATDHPKMPVSQRAKQFSPFSPLSGLAAALEKKRRELGLCEKKELSPEETERLSEAFARIRKGASLAVTYYDAGVYRRVEGRAERAPGPDGLLRLDGLKIPLADISDLTFLKK